MNKLSIKTCFVKNYSLFIHVSYVLFIPNIKENKANIIISIVLYLNHID